MRTESIVVSGEGEPMEAALNMTAAVASGDGLSRKNGLHLRLLTEEMMGMMRSITGQSEGEFWIEREDGEYRLHLRVAARMGRKEREQLLAASSSGVNEATRGIMGKIRAFFEFGDGEAPAFSSPFMLGNSAQMYGSVAWSMADYREELEQYRAQRREGAEDAWDELEKSVVSRVADDVRVSVRGRDAELIIVKKMA